MQRAAAAAPVLAAAAFAVKVEGRGRKEECVVAKIYPVIVPFPCVSFYTCTLHLPKALRPRTTRAPEGREPPAEKPKTQDPKVEPRMLNF